MFPFVYREIHDQLSVMCKVLKSFKELLSWDVDNEDQVGGYRSLSHFKAEITDQ